MRPDRAAAGALDHGFIARRDPTLLRAGLLAHIEPPTETHPAQLVLTNVSGHAYPTGTVRRALRIDISDDIDDSPRTLARLTSASFADSAIRQAVLKPAEQRRIALPTEQPASLVRCQVTYERNQFEKGALEVPLYKLEMKLVHKSGFAGEASD
jgi:hypothetical protein